MSEYNQANELTIINRAKNNDESAIKILVDTHSGIYCKVASKYMTLMNCHGSHYEDIIAEKDALIYQAAKTFDSSKNIKFCTYVGNLARWKCLHLINADKKHYTPITDNIYDLKESQIALNENKSREFTDFVYNILEQLQNKKIVEIFRLRFQGDKISWKSIGEKMGLSQQTVIKMYEYGIKVLKQKVKSEEWADKI